MIIEALNIAVFLDIREIRIGHADFLPLIDIRRAAHEMNRGREHLRRLTPVFSRITKA